MSTHGFPTLVDGRLFAAGEAHLSTDDAGFQLGLAVFESVLYTGGCAYFLEQHLARMRAGLAALSIEIAHDAPARALSAYLPALDDALAQREEDEVALRLMATRGVPEAGPSLVCAARSIVRPPDGGVVVALERRAKLAGDVLEQIKSTNRMRNVIAREAAERRGAWDALLCNEADEVCEATIANVFAVIDGVLVTPAVERGCLAGVMREALIAEIEASEHELVVGRLPIEQLSRASEVFLSNSTGRVVPVREVLDVAPRLAGSDGPLARELRERIRHAEQRYRRAARG